MITFSQLQERLTQQQKDDALYWRYKQLQNPKPKEPIDYKKEKLGLQNEEYIDEALISSLIRGAARYAMRNAALKKAASNTIKQPPKTLEFTKLFHGTTKKASDSISKGGWRGDVNVTRQYTGAGLVNATPDSMVAKSYAFDRAAKRNDVPFVRTFKVPKNVADKNMTTLHSGAGDYSGTGYKTTTLTTQQANKYDVTRKVDSSGIIDPKYVFDKEQKRELRQRVGRALRNPNAKEILNKDLKLRRKGLPPAS